MNYMDNFLDWLESTTPEERLAEGRGQGMKRYDCCEHCEHGINDPPHDVPCPDGCVEL